MLEGGLQAVQADEDVVGTSRVRELERRVRELERLLGRKTMEVEILKEALDVARVKNGARRFISVFKDPVYGWNAKIFAPPSKASGQQAILDKIVRVLRSQYDLEE